ncbi:hypothetical protein BH10PLA2_BH10PLA2_16170 [soil metagenome]
MLGKRKWKLFSVLVIPPIAMLVFAFGAGVKASQDSRKAYDDLREGMTVEEASEVLGRDLRRHLWRAEEFGGIEFNTYQFDMGSQILPGSKVELMFDAARLLKKERHDLSIHEFCIELLDRGKKFLRL